MSFIEVHPRCSGPHLHQTALHCSFSLCLFEASLLSGRSLHFFFPPKHLMYLVILTKLLAVFPSHLIIMFL